jgi:hypothetical protein
LSSILTCNYSLVGNLLVPPYHLVKDVMTCHDPRTG